MDEEELYRLKAFLDRSANRRKILELLANNEQPLRPTDIAKQLNVHRTTISTRITDLEKKGLVKVLNPEDNRNRYYKITEEREELLNAIQ